MTPLLFGASSWSWWHHIAWVTMNIVGFEMLGVVVRLLEKTPIPKIPINGPHHDTLGWTDISYIAFNKLSVALFVYHLFQYCWFSEEVTWSVDNIPIILLNIVVAVPLLFLVYDGFYVLFHRGLHDPLIYKYIHKHHHQQNAPTRGYTDAINAHPFEFVVGQWNHLWSLFLVCRFMPVHVLSVVSFMIIASMTAGLNHTRLDLGLGSVYQVKYHDAHHRFPNSNFGQYIVFWDKLMGSFKESRDTPTKKQIVLQKTVRRNTTKEKRFRE